MRTPKFSTTKRGFDVVEHELDRQAVNRFNARNLGTDRGGLAARDLLVVQRPCSP